MKVATIDCGTNSICPLVLSDSRKVPAEPVCEMRLMRLGQGVDATREFHPNALARTFAVCEEYVRIIRKYGAEKVRFVATSATRDVSNRRLLVGGVCERLGMKVDVIPGQEETQLPSMGALRALDMASPTLIVDTSGGSTELMPVDGVGTVLHSVSLNVGVVRLRERFLHIGPSTPGERKNARGFVGELLDGSGIDFVAIVGTVGVVGTITNVGARVLGLESYSRETVHGLALGCGDIDTVTEHWLTIPVGLIERELCMQPFRVGVIGAEALTLDETIP